MVVLIFVLVFVVLVLIIAIGMCILSVIPMMLENIAEIKEKWRELRGKDEVE